MLCFEFPCSFLGNLRHQNPTMRGQERVPKNSIFGMKMDADDRGKDDRHHNGRLVDQSLIVLRRRIHEMKIMEKKVGVGVDEPPSEWWAWEKKWHQFYTSDVLEAVGLLQILLMNARPSMVLGSGAFLLFSVFMSLFVIFCCLMNIVIKGIHF
ncbi:hypothetical protein Salat_1930900 [Sesamum alatum]|uniref:Uncharacterized protein n=1 Tax=Sesamum alatum TaxID=300844 RepID=A0AAE1Y5C8_9LAMI|nr:hypothetical protein Salat_1930900 [Sesamum alatum]